MDPLEKLVAITHDVKSPLLAIKRLAEGLLDDSSLDEGVRRRLELIHESAAEASEHLDEFNLSSTLNTGAEDHPPESVDVAAVAQKVVNGFQTQAECKAQTLRCTVSHAEGPSDCTVQGDPLQLREAMNNLVSNALKFSPEESTIGVSVRRSGDTVVFSVTDDGPGLTDEEQERLFEPLCNVGPEPTDGEDSTGVGLYIVRRIAENHEGRVEVESEKGEGSTFRLLLPAASSPCPSRAHPDHSGAELSAPPSASALS